ncbi:hypothetical protein J2847_006428 [Azospirillum agricola]|uniref:hypothetical protein n=1 Tax=Azospirillum agricola TaxID=1720247 RepID=UPI001AEB8AB0|nr:hypothetical protein [Azospirillum agricola]MBP2233093.1 hypothetical protein [Azospirillum agricola]
MKKLLERTAAAVGVILLDLTGVAGAASVAYGAWLAWPPAGFIVGGGLVIAGVSQLSRTMAARGDG